mgnify:CR=1 FL=1
MSFDIYTEKLKNLPIVLPKVRKNTTHVFHLYVIKTRRRNTLLNFMKSNGVILGVHYLTPIHLQPAYKKRIAKTDMSVTEELSNNIVLAKIDADYELENIYSLYGVEVTGSHLIRYNDKWIRVREHPDSVSIPYKLNKVVCLVTKQGTIEVNNITFKDYLETRAEELKISKYITFHGYVSNVIEEMKKSSIIVAPSDLDEPLGRVAMESKRLGIPVIASDKGGFLEIINHRVNGLLFEQKSYDALSKTIYDIYNNLSLRLSLAEEGLKQSKEWSSKNYSKNLLKFIEENK